jgi:hypothetical protein
MAHHTAVCLVRCAWHAKPAAVCFGLGNAPVCVDILGSPDVLGAPCTQGGANARDARVVLPTGLCWGRRVATPIPASLFRPEGTAVTHPRVDAFRGAPWETKENMFGDVSPHAPVRRRRYTPQPRVSGAAAPPWVTKSNPRRYPEGVSQMFTSRINPTRIVHRCPGHICGRVDGIHPEMIRCDDGLLDWRYTA